MGTSRHANAASKSRPRSHATGRRTSSVRCPAARKAVTRLSMWSSAPPRANGTWAPQTQMSISASQPGGRYCKTTIAQDESLLRVNAPQTFWRGFPAAVRDIWQFRELLLNLVRKELKVKYKDSTLGFLWSLARP